MSTWLDMLAGPVGQHLIEALLHTLWQGGLLVILLYLLLRKIPVGRTGLRYVVSVGMLAGLLFGGLLTWSILEYQTPTQTADVDGESASLPPSENKPAARNQADPISVTPDAPPQFAETWEPSPSNTMPWMAWGVVIWLAGVVVMLTRMAIRVMGVSRLGRQCRLLDDPAVLCLLDQLRASMRITQRVRIAVCEHIRMPAVMGILSPMLLLPASALTGMPTDYLRAIIAHELAHIRRYDYLVNLVQMFIEAILFFNPAVWWLSRQIRIEREACCDALAAGVIGERVGYARAVAEWAQMLRPLGPSLVAMPAFGDARRPMLLLDRVKRLVVSDHRPTLKMSWIGLVGIFVIGGVLLAALRIGTDLTVALAGQILTPQQRLEKLAEIDRSYGTDRRGYGEEGKIRISGTVRTADGTPLTEPAVMEILTRNYSGSMSSGAKLEGGRFSIKCDYGRVWLQVRANGHAPAFLGPLEAEPGGEIENIEIVLERGFEGRIQLINEGGEPVIGAILEGGYDTFPNTLTQSIKMETDDRGFAVIKDCGTIPVSLQVRVDGYQDETFNKIELKPDEVVVKTLKSARVTTGVVLDRASRKPLAGALIRMLGRVGPGNHIVSLSAEDSEILARTDAQGRFRLTQLHDDWLYTLMVEAPNYARDSLKDVEAGQQDIMWLVGPELYIRGTIKGDLTKLKKTTTGMWIHYSNSYYTGPKHQHGSGGRVDVTQRDGVGHFEIKNLLAGWVEIEVAGHNIQITIDDEPIDDLVIDLDKEATQVVHREIIICFDVPPGHPQPRGTTGINYTHHNAETNVGLADLKYVPIEDGQARLSIPVPADVTVGPKGTVGYWFAEHRQKIDMDEHPCVLTLPVVPAGSIFGQVLNADGSVGENVHVSVIVVEQSPLIEKNRVDTNDINQSLSVSGKFNLTPLPLGGTYVVTANHGSSYVLGPEITLDEKNPIQQVNLRLADGLPVSGQVMDPEGNPIRNIKVELSYSTPFKSSFDGPFAMSDEQGRFDFEAVNPDVLGSYSLNVREAAGWQPYRAEAQPGQPVVVALKRGGIVTGVVLDNATGYPVPNVSVYATGEHYESIDQNNWHLYMLKAESETNQHGEFRFSNLPAGRRYNLNVGGGADLVDPRKPVAVVGDQKEPVTLRIKIRERSQLKPRKPDPGE